MQTHLEPLAEAGEGHVRPSRARPKRHGVVRRIVREALGRRAARAALPADDEGLVAFLTLGLDPTGSLAEAHDRASEVEARIRRARPEIADVIVHTEP